MIKNRYRLREGIPLLLILLIGVPCSLLLPHFGRLNNYLSILKQSSFMAILSVGMLMVLITGEIDLSMGAQFGFFGMLCAFLLKTRLPIPLALLITLLAAALMGGLIGWAVSLFSGKSLLLTIAISLVVRGLSYMISSGIPIYWLPTAFTRAMGTQLGGISVSVLGAAVCGVLGALILHYTYLGKYFYAVGANLYAAVQSGISVRSTKVKAFILCSLFTALGSIFYLGWIGSATLSTGNGMELDVLTAAAIAGVGFDGGKGKVVPTITGALFLGVLSAAFIALNVASNYQNVLKGFILFSAILTNRSDA